MLQLIGRHGRRIHNLKRGIVFDGDGIASYLVTTTHCKC